MFNLLLLCVVQHFSNPALIKNGKSLFARLLLLLAGMLKPIHTLNRLAESELFPCPGMVRRCCCACTFSTAACSLYIARVSRAKVSKPSSVERGKD